MWRIAGTRSSRDRLRWLLSLFFIALAIPSAVLTWQAYSRLQWESFYQYQLLAEGLLGRIDRRVREMIATEEARAFTDYRFLVVEGASVANSLQRSPLSGFPVNSVIPGLLGYFQVDADGRFSTPLLPDDPGQSALAYGITNAELRQRQAVRERLLQILSQEGALLDDQPAETALKGGVEPASEKSTEDRRERQEGMAPAAASVRQDAAPFGVARLSSRAPQAGSRRPIRSVRFGRAAQRPRSVAGTRTRSGCIRPAQRGVATLAQVQQARNHRPATSGASTSSSLTGPSRAKRRRCRRDERYRVSRNGWSTVRQRREQGAFNGAL